MAKPKKTKQFKYNLSSVLKVREIKEKQETEKFQEAERHYFEELKKEEELKDMQKEKYRELRTIMDPGATISDFQQVLMRKSHLEIVQEQVAEAEHLKEEAERLKEEQREHLIKAVLDKKIIEKDKEKKKEKWRKVMDKEYDKFLDDISTVRYSRAKREKSGS